MMSLATVGSCHVFVEITTLQRKDREDILGAPITSEGLFGSISSVTQRFIRLEKEKTQLSCHLLLAPSSNQSED